MSLVGGYMLLTLSETRARKQREVFENLIVQNRDTAFGIAKKLLKTWGSYIEKDELQSLVDQAVCSAANNYDATKGSEFLTLAFYHIRGCLIAHIKQKKHERDNFVSFEPSAQEVVQDVITDRNELEDVLYQKQVNAVLQKACKKLNDLERLVIEEIITNEKSVNQIAKAHGYSRSHLSRVKNSAIRKLKKKVQMELS